MPVPDPASSVAIDLSRAEQWVSHHVLLDEIGLADGDQTPTDETDPSTQVILGVLEKLESGTFEFTAEELTTLQSACREHARTTDATADRNLATAVSDRIGATVRRERPATDE